jgi:hypothetical protein
VNAAYIGCKQFLGDGQGDYLDRGAGKFGNDASIRLKAYRNELRRLLRGSGLAQMLPSGTGMLPAPEEVLPNWYLPIYRSFTPGSYQHLIQHLGQFLPCYLRMHEAADVVYRIQRNAVMGTTAFGLLIVARTLQSIPNSILLIICFLLYIVAIIMGYCAIFLPGASLIYKQINFSELYYYLLDAYSDAPEAASAALEDPLAP